ncbi:MAG: MFS transporter [Sporolactobacillus sp.]
MTRLKKNHFVFMTAIASGSILNPLNSSMIALALHSIQHSYALDFATVSWLVSGFYLVSAVGQPATGKLGDLIGRKKLFLGGLIIAGIASFFAPLAPFFVVLLLMRLLQAAGSSAIYPSGVALVNNHVNKKKQASALAVLAISASVMTAFGPTVGGFLIIWGGWQSIFYVNFPFILLSLLLGFWVIPADPKKSPTTNHGSFVHQLDLVGIALFTLSIVCVLWFLLELEVQQHWIVLAVGVVAAIALIRYEYSTDTPFIDVRLIGSNHQLSLIYLLFIFLNIANYCLFYGMPSFFQSGLHWSVRASGTMMLFMSLASVVASLLSGRWIDRSGTSGPIRVGALLTCLGSIWMLLIIAHLSVPGMGIFLLLMGAGYGISNVSLQATMLHLTPSERIGTGSGLFQTCRYIGSIAASAILGILFQKTIAVGELTSLMRTVCLVSVLALTLSVLYFSRKTLKAN